MRIMNEKHLPRSLAHEKQRVDLVGKEQQSIFEHCCLASINPDSSLIKEVKMKNVVLLEDKVLNKLYH